MAEPHSTVHPAGHPAMDYEEHENTYRLFVTGAKWGMGFVALVLVLMAYFLL
ncbi:aa3-type cytochrome c oxidase subunit IV [Chelatococcus sp. SYSU_G07232]|uniref:Aa3-type cytochrome c oxidase subunit IV n=1 Tax=Chelatococcus albus TaxID=3047466 RepID=A0ABT7AG31_9HYPH|nr:aa3-type cytochrome c oxidase subunit IV [Chelatococcus sp. SYSU_G07232]MDJ1158288.1 aa3-type cytochrome c oxidase subunit IV [Chelatococcus sp. SYSU_G07232]